MTVHDGNAYWTSTGRGYVLVDAGTIYVIRILLSRTGLGVGVWSAGLLRLDALELEHIGKQFAYVSREDAAEACLRHAELAESTVSRFGTDTCSDCGSETDDAVWHDGSLLCCNCLPVQTVGERGAW